MPDQDEKTRTLDDLRSIAMAGVEAYSHMVEIGLGVGGLPEREFAATLAYDDTFDADQTTVLDLIDQLLNIRRLAETRAQVAWSAEDVAERAKWLDVLSLIAGGDA